MFISLLTKLSSLKILSRHAVSNFGDIVSFRLTSPLMLIMSFSSRNLIPAVPLAEKMVKTCDILVHSSFT